MWNRTMETMSRADLERLQLDRLRQVATRVYDRVPLYRQRFDEARIRPDQIRTLADLRRLPFTRKADFRDHYPFGLLAVPLRDCVRIHASSGTTGKPTVVAYTRADLAIWADVCARSLAASGAQPGDVFQNAYGYGLFTGGLGMHYGAELLGLTVIPASGGNTERQLLLLQDFGARIIACTPTYALVLAEACRERGIAPGSLPLRFGVLGAEPWTEAMRDEIERGLGIKAVNIYGLSEIIGPGVSNECVEAQAGAHIFEDHFLPEVVDPQTGEPLPAGQPGELVFTTLTKEAMPMIRYRTGDIAALLPEPCVCGRTHVRMSRVIGRTDDMLIIRGINVYPSQVEAALGGLPELTPHIQLVVTRERALDDLEVKVEVREAFAAQLGGGLPDGAPAVEELRARCEQKLHGVLGIHARVTLAAPGALPRSEGGKLRRVDDRRPRA
ncbi:MAG: phenylacetate--CoA ligase [Armatimonadota bacterium]|nr:phenylacetate--CoA ligase [Armatimonadota bacterium]MDR7486008.1 phenylacetate--CoA ligase [Armatimonadota bacterium]MDR7532579.1 phenylacetate--CoA ligase [Armatimonadota bacterium]MDR7536212.1 phenylacetate--CoA ligase [Armatimonadota bacterium]